MAPIKLPVFKLLLVICLIVLPAIAGACRPEGYIYTESGAVECGADGKPIVLFNNPAATDPTFDELIDFIQSDPTDRIHYVDGVFVCADFAEAVHNNAEAAGIRAGWVGVTFNGADIGHAINIFQTSDRGAVMIDCTGSSNLTSTDSRDMIAYIQEGSPYGVISLEKVIDSGMDYFSLTYDYYEQAADDWREYRELLADFNEEVLRYNAEIKSKTYAIGSPEEKRISAWEKKLIEQQDMLEAMEADNGGHWYESEFSSYTVSGIQMHW